MRVARSIRNFISSLSGGSLPCRQGLYLSFSSIAQSSRKVKHKLLLRKALNVMIFLVTFNIWPYRLTVRTSPSQGGNSGSIPGRVTKDRKDWTAPVFSAICEDGAMFL